MVGSAFRLKEKSVGLNLLGTQTLLGMITGANADLGQWLCQVFGICA
ncbi:hypothetical protein QFZ46_000938 [Microbacterium murale]|uniref:Uncharacterized protein n=1 Tax=Microbacterium murale TaxID=1081040 RepID=A0ABU0P625_9MICO|nr:hypothetical protein [Microbacterium murale]